MRLKGNDKNMSAISCGDLKFISWFVPFPLRGTSDRLKWVNGTAIVRMNFLNESDSEIRRSNTSSPLCKRQSSETQQGIFSIRKSQSKRICVCSLLARVFRVYVVITRDLLETWDGIHDIHSISLHQMRRVHDVVEYLIRGMGAITFCVVVVERKENRAKKVRYSLDIRFPFQRILTQRAFHIVSNSNSKSQNADPFVSKWLRLYEYGGVGGYSYNGVATIAKIRFYCRTANHHFGISSFE